MDLNGKKIIITGASSGIGKAILAELKAFDADILVGDLDPDAVETGDRCSAISCDVSEPKNIDKLFMEAEKKMGGVDLFIANAGFAYYEKIDNSDWDHIEKIYRVNFMAPVYAALKMEEINGDREHRTVITASAMAKLALPGYALYSSTKAALDSFAFSYRTEIPDPKSVTLVYPIATKTEFFKVAAGDTTPVPWPAQTSETVAKAVIKGIKRDKKSVFPSFLFRAMMALDRLFPVVFPLYVRIEAGKLRRWNEAKN